MMAPSGMDEGKSRPDKHGATASSAPGAIPARFEILELMRLMGRYAPVIMLSGEADGYGARWLLHGHEVQPAIARYLMEQGYLADDGATELGARKLVLTAAGIRFRDDGYAWWNSLGPLQKLKVRIFG
jgi:hypothetical protein